MSQRRSLGFFTPNQSSLSHHPHPLPSPVLPSPGLRLTVTFHLVTSLDYDPTTRTPAPALVRASSFVTFAPNADRIKVQDVAGRAMVTWQGVEQQHHYGKIDTSKIIQLMCRDHTNSTVPLGYIAMDVLREEHQLHVLGLMAEENKNDYLTPMSPAEIEEIRRPTVKRPRSVSPRPSSHYINGTRSLSRSIHGSPFAYDGPARELRSPAVTSQIKDPRSEGKAKRRRLGSPDDEVDRIAERWDRSIRRSRGGEEQHELDNQEEHWIHSESRRVYESEEEANHGDHTNPSDGFSDPSDDSSMEGENLDEYEDDGFIVMEKEDIRWSDQESNDDVPQPAKKKRITAKDYGLYDLEAEETSEDDENEHSLDDNWSLDEDEMSKPSRQVREGDGNEHSQANDVVADSDDQENDLPWLKTRKSRRLARDSPEFGDSQETIQTPTLRGRKPELVPASKSPARRRRIVESESESDDEEAGRPTVEAMKVNSSADNEDAEKPPEQEAGVVDSQNQGPAVSGEETENGVRKDDEVAMIIPDAGGEEAGEQAKAEVPITQVEDAAMADTQETTADATEQEQAVNENIGGEPAAENLATEETNTQEKKHESEQEESDDEEPAEEQQKNAAAMGNTEAAGETEEDEEEEEEDGEDEDEEEEQKEKEEKEEEEDDEDEDEEEEDGEEEADLVSQAAGNAISETESEPEEAETAQAKSDESDESESEESEDEPPAAQVGKPTAAKPSPKPAEVNGKPTKKTAPKTTNGSSSKTPAQKKKNSKRASDSMSDSDEVPLSQSRNKIRKVSADDGNDALKGTQTEGNVKSAPNGTGKGKQAKPAPIAPPQASVLKGSEVVASPTVRTGAAPSASSEDENEEEENPTQSEADVAFPLTQRFFLESQDTPSQDSMMSQSLLQIGIGLESSQASSIVEDANVKKNGRVTRATASANAALAKPARTSSSSFRRPPSFSTLQDIATTFGLKRTTPGVLSQVYGSSAINKEPAKDDDDDDDTDDTDAEEAKGGETDSSSSSSSSSSGGSSSSSESDSEEENAKKGQKQKGPKKGVPPAARMAGKKTKTKKKKSIFLELAKDGESNGIYGCEHLLAFVLKFECFNFTSSAPSTQANGAQSKQQQQPQQKQRTQRQRTMSASSAISQLSTAASKASTQPKGKNGQAAGTNGSKKKRAVAISSEAVARGEAERRARANKKKAEEVRALDGQDSSDDE
ncbi:hypothetical protein HK104_010801 [Borealophlyctis nickersoniae]|nr:hypothetical protein HK104_010801 [Borealophlyctis nickersoniae]